MANETAPVSPETGLNTAPGEQLRGEENDSSLSSATGQDTPAVDIPLQFEENYDIVQQPDIQEDDSMSLTNVAIAVGGDILLSI